MRKIYALFSVLLFFVHYKGQETLPYYQQYLLDGDFLYTLHFTVKPTMWC